MARAGRVPAYPVASNLPGGGGVRPDGRPHGASMADAGPAGSGTGVPDSVREALRAIIIDELRTLVGD